MRKLFSLFVLLPLLLCAQASWADPAQRIFLRFEGTGADLEMFNNAVHRFQKEIFSVEKSIEFVNRDDASNVYTQCHGLKVETDPMRERNCWFEVVERLGVEHFLEISLVAQSEGHFEFKLDIWSPNTRGLVYTNFVEQEASDLRAAFAEGLPRLAHDYLCFRGEDELCAPVIGVDGKPLQDNENPNYLAWGLIGAGGLMLVSIIPVAIVNRSNQEQLDAMAKTHPDRPSFEEATTENTVAMQVLGALGTVTFALGLTFLLLDVGLPQSGDGDASVDDGRILVTPTLSPDGFGLGVHLSF